MAQLVQNDKVVYEIPLTFAGEASTFKGSLTLDTAGEFDLVVLALDPTFANFGIIRQKLTVVPE